MWQFQDFDLKRREYTLSRLYRDLKRLSAAGWPVAIPGGKQWVTLPAGSLCRQGFDCVYWRQLGRCVFLHLFEFGECPPFIRGWCPDGLLCQQDSSRRGRCPGVHPWNAWQVFHALQDRRFYQAKPISCYFFPWIVLQRVRSYGMDAPLAFVIASYCVHPMDCNYFAESYRALMPHRPSQCAFCCAKDNGNLVTLQAYGMRVMCCTTPCIPM